MNSLSVVVLCNVRSLFSVSRTRGVQEQMITEAHCRTMLLKYLEFRSAILRLNILDDDTVRELILSQSGQPASPGLCGESIAISLFSHPLQGRRSCK